MAPVAAKHARRRTAERGPGRGRRPPVGAAGRPAGTVAGRVAGQLPTGVAPTGLRQALRQPAAAAPLVIDLTVAPATTAPASAAPPRGRSARARSGVSAASRPAAVVLLLVGLVAAACLVLLDLSTGARAVAGLVALWGVVVGGFALARPVAPPR